MTDMTVDELETAYNILEIIKQRTQAIFDEIESSVITAQDKKEYWPVWRKDLFERQRIALTLLKEKYL